MLSGVGPVSGVRLEPVEIDRKAVARTIASQIANSLGVHAKSQTEMMVLKSQVARGEASVRDVAIAGVLSSAPIKKFFEFNLDEITFIEILERKLLESLKQEDFKNVELILSEHNEPVGLLKEILAETKRVYSRYDIPKDYKVHIEMNTHLTYQKQEPVLSVKHEVMGEVFWSCDFSMTTFKEMATSQPPRARL